MSITGLNLLVHAAGKNGIMAEQVGFLRLYNMTIQGFTNDGIHIASANSNLAIYITQIKNNGNDGLLLDAAGTRAYVQDSAFDDNAVAGADSGAGKLTITDSAAEYNLIGFYAHGGTVALSGDRAIFNGTALAVSFGGNLHFANCLLSDNTTAWVVMAGGVLSGSSPGTTLTTPGQKETGPLSPGTTLD